MCEDFWRLDVSKGFRDHRALTLIVNQMDFKDAKGLWMDCGRAGVFSLAILLWSE